MKTLKAWMALGLIAAAPISGTALANDVDVNADLDVDVSVVDAEATAADAINLIELPEAASSIAADAAAAGLETAQAAIAASADGEEAQAEVRAAGKLKAEEVAALIADAMAQSEAAIAEANAAALSAQENAAAAREAAEEALKNALSGADYEGSMADVQAIIDNLPQDVKDRLPVDLDSLLERVMDFDPSAAADVGVEG
ncbi:hypothetical protein [Microbulbifer hydrolyticus]|uniref:Regulator of protease activity HflC (Stomatin/prohibitin superfamily) n=1 Tax=Microbulbifer hydrolyticus TaxID=48074 RepID=A0A6P1T8J2_9GAMM|nr:hypothetical protein [Microbulbifer hydrolyticus]MBB5211379.1 regulator of protease activity HflC (stomatin/prohibitin superfamily) [Microbulbifer hydrolyticus]QHQ37866.1 hypothetical protein GTQ55_01885 [Microbulbifer hydrolyticus]